MKNAFPWGENQLLQNYWTLIFYTMLPKSLFESINTTAIYHMENNNNNGYD